MKKTTAIVAALAVSLFCANAFAQAPEKESYLFNHWSVGVGLSLPHGLNVQAAGTILPNLQVRVVYNNMFPYIGIANAVLKNNPNVGSINPFVTSIALPGGGYHQNGVNIDKIDIEGRLKSSELNFLIDFLPSEISSIRLTAGVVLDLSPDMVTITGKPVSNDGSAALQPSDCGNVEIAGITTDLQGNVNFRASYGLKTVRPYLGFGFGRPVDPSKRVTVNFDLGVAYTGGIHLYSQSYLLNPQKPAEVELNEAWINDPNNKVGNQTLKEALGTSADSFIKYVGMANSIPIMPYLRFTINVRLF